MSYKFWEESSILFNEEQYMHRLQADLKFQEQSYKNVLLPYLQLKEMRMQLNTRSAIKCYKENFVHELEYLTA